MPRPVFQQSGERIEFPGAVARDRRALTRRERAADPADRADAHANLADALERTAIASAVAEAHRHRLAALVYMLEGSLGESFNVLLAGYATRFRRGAAAGESLAVPRLTEVLDDPAFVPLDDWLREHAADVDGVQTAVDFYLEQARRIGTGQGLGERAEPA